jgi:hypothetical protein
MTYSILSLESGSILESYRTEDNAMEAASRIYHAEPDARESFAVVVFDDGGMPVETLAGDDLSARIETARHATA